MTTRIAPGVGANLLGQHSAERNQDATAYVGNLDPQISEELLWELFVQAGPVGTITLSLSLIHFFRLIHFNSYKLNLFIILFCFIQLMCMFLRIESLINIKVMDLLNSAAKKMLTMYVSFFYYSSPIIFFYLP